MSIDFNTYSLSPCSFIENGKSQTRAFIKKEFKTARKRKIIVQELRLREVNCARENDRKLQRIIAKIGTLISQTKVRRLEERI